MPKLIPAAQLCQQLTHQLQKNFPPALTVLSICVAHIQLFELQVSKVTEGSQNE
ncbi:hypothetical protein ACWYXJ_29465 [Janthinobacterium lividum]